MSTEFFPKEIIDNSAESNFQKHTVRTKLIYSTTVLFIVAALVALPFINVDVSVRSQGIIQPLTDRNQLTSMVSGKIKELRIRENESVKQGQKVAEIAAPLLQEKLFFNTQRQKEVKKYLKDLSVLQHIDSASVFNSVDLVTAKYSRSLLQFKQQVRSNLQEIEKTERIFRRNKQLYQREVLSEATYEQSKFALQAVRGDLRLLFEQQWNEWQSQQINYQDEWEQLETKEQQLEKELEQHVIRAPISGTIQNMKGIYEGSLVYPNQTLAEISPDTGLIAKCYIPPKDIGLYPRRYESPFPSFGL